MGDGICLTTNKSNLHEWGAASPGDFVAGRIFLVPGRKRCAENNLAGRRTHAGKVVGKEALAEKGGVDAARAVAFAYDIYTNPSKNNGVLGTTLTKEATTAIHGRWDFYNHE
jgi:hypothetical protein